MRKDTRNGRRLAVYFATVEERKAFSKLARQYGLADSMLGLLSIMDAMKGGFLDRLASVAAEEKSVIEFQQAHSRVRATAGVDAASKPAHHRDHK